MLVAERLPVQALSTFRFPALARIEKAGDGLSRRADEFPLVPARKPS